MSAVAGVLLAALLLAAAPAMGASDPVIMAAGDIACDQVGSTAPGPCSDMYTSNLARAQMSSATGLAALLAIGDTQYEDATLTEYTDGFDHSWGAPDLRPVLRPVPGNHEYLTSGASGYFDYFKSIGVNVGTAGQGWYSFDLGSWHLIALNSSDGCITVSCAAGSAQETWLKNDLATTTQPCILAYLHHPLAYAFPREQPIWQDLYNAGVDFVLTGHKHTYQAPTPIDPSGNPDPNGPRQVIVGTGGKDGTPAGVLKMTLGTGNAAWQFIGVNTDGSPITDSGTATCHNFTTPPTPPPPPPPPAKPVSSFTWSASDLTVSFTDTSTNTPTNWTWDFGDGTGRGPEDPTPTPTHTYAQPGTYTVTLVSSNAGGAGAKATQQVTVTVPPTTTTSTPPPTPDPVVTPTPPPVQPVIETPVVTPQSTPIVPPPTLTTTSGRALVRNVLSHRLKQWRVAKLTCKASSTTKVTCAVSARYKRRTAKGTGTLTLRTTTRTISGQLRLRFTRPTRTTSWSFRSTV